MTDFVHYWLFGLVCWEKPGPADFSISSCATWSKTVLSFTYVYCYMYMYLMKKIYISRWMHSSVFNILNVKKWEFGVGINYLKKLSKNKTRLTLNVFFFFYLYCLLALLIFMILLLLFFLSWKDVFFDWSAVFRNNFW